MIVERRHDKVMIRDKTTGDVVATRVRRNGAYAWQATDPHVQEIIDTWKNGSTIEAIAKAIDEDSK